MIFLGASTTLIIGNREIHYRDVELQTYDFEEELIIMTSFKHAIIINSYISLVGRRIN